MFGIKLDSELIIYLMERDYMAEKILESYCKKHTEYWINKKVCPNDPTIDQYELCKEGPNVPFVDLTVSVMDEMVVDIIIENNEIFNKFIIESEEFTVEEALEKYKDNYESTIYCRELDKVVSRPDMKNMCRRARDKGCDRCCLNGENQSDKLKISDGNNIGAIVGISDTTYYGVPGKYIEFESLSLDY